MLHLDILCYASWLLDSESMFRGKPKNQNGCLIRKLGTEDCATGVIISVVLKTDFSGNAGASDETSEESPTRINLFESHLRDIHRVEETFFAEHKQRVSREGKSSQLVMMMRKTTGTL
ncbi:unnamed protein product [Microthlaspi erraticum]|uniref:Uncharacterized protein n=1 Tax=Microthlaspi erraticum TaxID=1685480 RepID=A0A6D2HII7_9BRAS|nr:unnamed protein product [Microthlaspi erraticum]